MSETPRTRIEQVLGYEHLDDDARAEIDAELARSPELRALRDALLERERRARPRGELPELERWPELPLDAAGRAGEAAARHALLQRAGVAVHDVLPLRPARRTPRRVWLVPAMAAAAAVIAIAFWPRGAVVPPPPSPAPSAGAPARTPALAALAIEPAAEMRGGAPRAWRSGDAFVLRFRLATPAAPAVFLLDASGGVARLHPAEGEPLRLRPAGDVRLPDPKSGTRWAFEGPAGRETFVVAALPDTADVAALTASARAAVAGAPSPEARLEALEAALRRATPDVIRLAIEHR